MKNKAPQTVTERLTVFRALAASGVPMTITRLPRRA
jgi:hypothetical protein